MLISEAEINSRAESPNNLLNRLKNLSKTSPVHIVSIPPKSEELIPDIDNKLKAGSNNAKSKALRVMNLCLDELTDKLPEVKAERLATIADTMNRIVTSSDQRAGSDLNVQVVVYRPQIAEESDFQVIDVRN